MEAKHREIKSFLHARVYRHHTVNGSMSKARRIMKDLFAVYLAEPEVLPEGAPEGGPAADGVGTRRFGRARHGVRLRVLQR